MKPMVQWLTSLYGHVMPRVVRPLHALWNEVIGFLFIVFAVVAGFYVVRAARAFDGNFESLVHVVLPGLFGALMAYFGISSFLRARKISRS
jgi:uncharacterized membrane protein